MVASVIMLFGIRWDSEQRIDSPVSTYIKGIDVAMVITSQEGFSCGVKCCMEETHFNVLSSSYHRQQHTVERQTSYSERKQERGGKKREIMVTTILHKLCKSDMLFFAVFFFNTVVVCNILQLP